MYKNEECLKRINEILYTNEIFSNILPNILHKTISLQYSKLWYEKEKIEFNIEIPIINFDEIEELMDKYLNDYKSINEKYTENYIDIYKRQIDLINITVNFYTTFLNKLRI
jgi:hypothetical protein